MPTQRLLRTLLCCALVLTATPLRAQSFDAELRIWGRALDAAGVRILDSTTCPPGLVARYIPRSRSIQLCSIATRSEDFFLEAITHEAVHAAQHCLAYHQGKPGYLPITLAIDEIDSQEALQFLTLISNKASKKDIPTQGSALDQMIEDEAYALESEPDAVRDFLRIACS